MTPITGLQANCRCRLKRERVGKYPAMRQQHPLAAGQEFETPVECRAQCFLPRHGCSPPFVQDRKTVIKALGEACESEIGNSRRGQFQRKWKAVKLATYLDDGRYVVVAKCERLCA